MYREATKRIVVLFSFALAVICLIVNLIQGSDLLHAAFSALCVMLAVSMVLFYVVRGVALVLYGFLKQQSGRAQRTLEEASHPPPPESR